MNEVPIVNFVFLALSVGSLVAAVGLVLRPEEARTEKRWHAWLFALVPMALAVQFAMSPLDSIDR